jgi:hypothetical protein
MKNDPSFPAAAHVLRNPAEGRPNCRNPLRSPAGEMISNWYPRTLHVGNEELPHTCAVLEGIFSRESIFSYAELGIYEGNTARSVCERFPNATLFLFDFTDRIEAARRILHEYPNRVFLYPNSQRFNDSYNWALIKLIAANRLPIFDYCFIDGARTVAVDGLAFFLCDRLLKGGGFMEFDDIAWKIRGSSLDPEKVPEINLQYTYEQIDSFQVQMLVDSLVKRDPSYKEVVKDRVFQKCEAQDSHR